MEKQSRIPYRFTVLTDSLIRMEYQADGKFVDGPTQTVVCREFEPCEYRVIDKEDSYEIITDKLHLYYDKKPFSPEGLSIQLKEGFHVYGSVWNYGDEINDLRGTARTLDGANGAIELESGILSRDGFTVLDDSNSAQMTLDLWIEPKKVASIDLYFFGYGHDYLRCLKDFYHLTGATPLLPRFTLGNWWSRFYPYTEETYIALMERFRESNIPFSTAVIDMDWHLTNIPSKYGSGWTGYTWNREYFPEPKRFMSKLHEMGMKVTLNVHPADGVRGHEETYYEMARELGIDYENEDKIPFNSTDRTFMEAYFKYLHHPNEEQGVDFWWIDWQQGSKSGIAGVDTLWMLNHLHFWDLKRRGKNPLIFSRYAGVGSHRYPIGFSGDSVTSWESLDFQPYFTANASNVGYSWWSHDIGGHQGGKKDDELSIRWMQFGVFSPIMRLHSTANRFYGKEPWNYGKEAEEIMVNFLRLRHRLIPYLHTMNYLTHREGLPLVQPMYYRHDVDEAYQVPNQYYFGSSMIACPITKQLNKETLLGEVDVWLPEGVFYDFFTGQVYRGGRKMTLYRSVETIPVLIPAGAIVPLAGDYMESHTRNPKRIEILVFNGEDGSFDLYEDASDDYQQVEPVISHITFVHGEHARFRIIIDGEAERVIPNDREYDIYFRGVFAPTAIKVLQGETVISDSYNAQKRELRVTFAGGKCREFEIEIQWENPGIVTPDKKEMLYKLLHRAQISYEIKEAVYNVVCQETNRTRLLARLQQMRLEKELLGAIYETIVSDE